MSSARIVVFVLLAAAVGFALGRVSTTLEPPAQRQSRAPAPADATAASLHQALMTPDPLQRAAALGRLLDALGPADLQPARQAYEAVVLDSADWEVQLFVQWWARFDAPAAADWALFHYLGRHPSVMATAVRAWAQQDPVAARAWVMKTTGGPYLRYPAITALLWGWDESGQPGIWEFIEEAENIIDQQYALAILVRRRLLRDGPEATFRWADRLPDDQPGDASRLKQNTFRRIGAKLAEIDPPAAAQWAAQVGEGEFGEGVYRRVAWSWVRSDGAAAMSWLGTLPPGPRRDDAVNEGFRRWLSLNSPAALAWIEGQPQELWLDPARLWQATAASKRDNLAGLAIAQAIEDRELRKRGLFLILRAWRSSDPAAADAWMAQNDIPASLLETPGRFPDQEAEPPGRRRRAREHEAGASAGPADASRGTDPDASGARLDAATEEP